jgi:hypothetical protein
VVEGTLQKEVVKYSKFDAQVKELALSSKGENAKVRGSLKSIKTTNIEAEELAKETERRYRLEPEYLQALLDAAEEYGFNTNLTPKANQYPPKKLSKTFDEFYEFIDEYALPYARINGKIPFFCTYCDDTYFYNRNRVEELQAGKFMVNLMDIFEDNANSKDRKNKVVDLNQLRINFFKALGCQASDVKDYVWPVVHLLGKSKGKKKRNYHHCVTKRCEEKEKLSDAQITIEHEKIKRMFTPKSLEDKKFLEDLHIARNSSSEEAYLGKRVKKNLTQPRGETASSSREKGLLDLKIDRKKLATYQEVVIAFKPNRQKPRVTLSTSDILHIYLKVQKSVQPVEEPIQSAE